MPHLRIRFLKEEQVAQLSLKLLPELSESTGTPISHFTLEHIPTRLYAEGALIEGDPFCEVLWFDRPQEMQDKVAHVITARLRMMAPTKDAVVVFVKLAANGYYENGVHF